MEDMFKEEKFDKFGGEDKFDAMDNVRLEETYAPPSQLKFAPEITSRFAESGFRLKWVHNERSAIRKRLHPSEGYSFVAPTELLDDEKAMLGDIEQFDGKEIVTNGDLVLMKVRIEKNEARRKYYENRTKAQADAINQRLMDNKIENSSRSVVRTGKNAHFSS
jgi:hypothetical protein